MPVTSYNIFFTNNFSSGNDTQDYALFSEIPTVTGVTGSDQVYSNAYLTNTGMPNGGTWDIKISKEYYAFCGLAPKQVAPGVVVSVGQALPATLATAAQKGSDFTLVPKDNKPTIETSTAFSPNLGSFEIDTNTDFAQSQNFIIGLAGVDGQGRKVPIATIPAKPNSNVNIQPVSKYYIGAFSASRGSVINVSSSSNKAAVIDFSANPGMLSATVSQESNGAFTVNYSPSVTVLALRSSGSQPSVSTSPLGNLVRLQCQFQVLAELIGSVLHLAGEIYDAGLTPVEAIGAQATSTRARYDCSAVWINKPDASQQTAMLNTAMQVMEDKGFHYEGGSIAGPSLKSQYTEPLPGNLTQARAAWREAYNAIRTKYGPYVDDQRCEPAAGIADAEAIENTGLPSDALSADGNMALQQRLGTAISA